MSDQAKAQRRALDFRDYGEIADEVRRLRTLGYQRLGQWNLGQCCAHLGYYVRSSMDGFSERLPRIVSKLFGRFLLKRISTKGMKSGLPTSPKSVIAPSDQDEARIDEFLELLERIQSHQGPLRDSPFFGELSVEEWRRLHCAHAAHHLGFLIPSETA